VFRDSDKPLEEREYPDEADLSDEEDEEESAVRLSRCPACGELIYEQAQQCPYCKEWIVPRERSWRDSRKWYVRGGLYLTKTLLLNWFFWLALAAIAAAAAVWEILK
jgi:hypothetical protein